MSNRQRNRTWIWHCVNKIYAKKYCRPRWKGYCEFMIWECFSYNFKKLMHCWKFKTPTEKKEAEKDLIKLNKVLELYVKADWKEKQRALQALKKRKRGQCTV